MINEKVSVRDFKEFESDIRGIGLVDDLLGNLSQTELRYYYEENTELTLSLDNIKTVLEKYAVKTGNYVGISIINIRFNPGNYATAILRREGQSLSAIVYATLSSVVPPHLLYYSGGVWTDILLASGRQQAGSTETSYTTVPNNTWTDLKTITLTQGVWNAEVMALFPMNSVGSRWLAFKDDNQYLYNYTALNDGPQTIRANKTYFVGAGTTKELTLQAKQNSGVGMSVTYMLLATRLS